MTFTSHYPTEHEVVLEEPWCKLHTGKDLNSWSKDDEIKWNQTHRQTEKYKFYIKAFDFITDKKLKVIILNLAVIVVELFVWP